MHPQQQQPSVPNPYGQAPLGPVHKTSVTEVTALATLAGWMLIVVNCLLLLSALLTSLAIVGSSSLTAAFGLGLGLGLLVSLGFRAAGILLGYYIKNGSMTAIIIATVLQGLLLLAIAFVALASNGVDVLLPPGVIALFMFLFLLATVTSQARLNRHANARAAIPSPIRPSARTQSTSDSEPIAASIKVIRLACQVSETMVDKRSDLAQKLAEEIYRRGFARQLMAELDGILGNPDALRELQHSADIVSLSSNLNLKKRLLKLVRALLSDESSESKNFAKKLYNCLSRSAGK